MVDVHLLHIKVKSINGNHDVVLEVKIQSNVLFLHCFPTNPMFTFPEKNSNIFSIYKLSIIFLVSRQWLTSNAVMVGSTRFCTREDGRRFLKGTMAMAWHSYADTDGRSCPSINAQDHPIIIITDSGNVTIAIITAI